MSTTFFTQVLDEPYHLGNGEFLAVVTNGKVIHEGETSRDYNKDAGAKAGLLRVNASGETTFVDFYEHSDHGDRYRGVAVVGNTAYVMRTQKDKVDSVVRVAAVNLETNTVSMIAEEGVTVHGSITPKTFCGHFNFGRPIVVGTKVIYPPLNSGMIIELETTTNTFTIHEIEEGFASIHSVYVEKLNEVVFFPYGRTTNKLVTLNIETQTTKNVTAPTNGAFYHVNTNGKKAIAAPLIQDDSIDFNFWVYDGNMVESVTYDIDLKANIQGQKGFKYGTMNKDTLIAHTIWDGCNEFVSVNLDTFEVDSFKTNKSLGSKPVILNNEIYLFPSKQNPTMDSVDSKVFKVLNKQITEAFDVGTANITSGSINDTTDVTMLSPYRFDISDNTITSNIILVDLKNGTTKTVPVSLELE